MARMARVSGRTDDMLIVRGVNVFPSQVETVLLQLEGVQPHYQIIVDREHGAMDELEIWVEVSPEVFSDEIGSLRTLQRRPSSRSMRRSACSRVSSWWSRAASSAARARRSA